MEEKQNDTLSDLHDEHGRFRPGHPKRGGAKAGYRRARSVLMEQLYPFYENMGELIQSIESPYDRVRAIALMSRHTMPTLSSVDYRESAQRSLTAEEQLARMNARYSGKPDPSASAPYQDTDDISASSSDY